MSRKFLPLGLVLLLAAGLSMFTACEYEFIEPEPVVLPDVVSFADDIIPIFDNSCNFSGCHVSGFGPLDLSAENAYNDLFRKELIDVDNPEASGLYEKLNDSGGTHSGRSTPAERAIILEWIRKGAQNN